MKLSYLTSLVVTVLLMGCALFHTALSKPKISVKGVSLQHVSFKTTELAVHFLIENTSEKHKIDASKVEYKMYIDKLLVGEGTHENVVQIEPKTAAELDMPVTLKTSELLSKGLVLINNGDVDYMINVRVYVGPFSIPIEKTGKISLQKSNAQDPG